MRSRPVENGLVRRNGLSIAATDIEAYAATLSREEERLLLPIVGKMRHMAVHPPTRTREDAVAEMTNG